MLSFQIVIPAPFMTFEEYSRHTGMPKRTLKDWAAKGKLILKKERVTKRDTTGKHYRHARASHSRSVSTLGLGMKNLFKPNIQEALQTTVAFVVSLCIVI